MQTIGFYSTPSSGKALKDYINLFSVEQNAAVIGHVYWYEIMTCEDFEQFCEEHEITPEEQMVALTCAGMTWNFHAKRVQQAEENLKQQIMQKGKLEDEANVTK